MAALRGIIFDKDGTLFDFQATWAGWAGRFVGELSALTGRPAEAIAGALGYDLAASRFLPHSPAIAGTNRDILEALAPHLSGVPVSAVHERMARATLQLRQVPAAPLGPLMETLRAAGHVLGVATNDSEAAARGHLAEAGIDGAFDFVAGYDSGHGGKPAPGQLVAFCAATGLAPHEVAMVGDSLHDLRAAAAAGMTGIGVLSGVAPEAELAPHAAAVLPHVGHLPDWLATRP